ncbi:procathepsin L-like [Sardina pilchardus]|uniref:procathepsin L-like n=1 Tax=Sardina pilchardus TaxID=27697 RepID=UPI002E0E8CFD
MKLLIIAAASLAVVSCASLSLEDLEFHAWKLKFGKSYRTAEEEARRKDIWLSTRRRVLTHNILADQGIKTYRMGINQFSDLDDKEYRHTLMNNLVPPNATKTSHEQSEMYFRHTEVGAKVPKYQDWRQMGCVTDVKVQNDCHSSWAFSATGALESHTCIYKGHLPSLSEQQLVDCSRSFGNDGCNGGSVVYAFQYVVSNNGIDTEDSYPYEAKESTCQSNPNIGAYCIGIRVLIPGDEDMLQAAVGYMGPVSAVIDATQASFQSYTSGVYGESQCSSSSANHAVLVVGYGSEGGQDYWLVKNSWGVNWGDEGYIKMSRNKNNQCGIASQASFPLV